ncbi:MAG: Hpt domain-containing protein [Parvibaculum sp.]
MALSTAVQQAAGGDGARRDLPHTAQHRPIDLVHLSKYTLGNRSLENELLGLFRNQADVYLARLVEADGDSEWKNAAHSLKGSARGLGAWALGDLAEEAEMLAADARPAIMARIADAIAAVNAFIDSVAEG